jgi:hypothetical protein
VRNNLQQYATYQEMADKHKAKAVEYEARITDIDRAIEALSYPGDES